jgi:SnoaL-like protein
MDVVFAEREITRVLYRYAQGVDRRIFDQIAVCYWPDGSDNRVEGSIDDYVAWLREVLPNVATSTHQYTNVLIDVDLAAGTATSEAYCLNASVFADPAAQGAAQLTTVLRYLDEWQRRDGEWRIFARVVVRDWAQEV